GRERGRDRTLCGCVSEDRIALGVCGIGSRQRKRSGSDVARRTREERDAAILAEAARSRTAANRGFIHGVAWQESGTQQRVSRRQPDRNLVARAPESRARVR